MITRNWRDDSRQTSPPDLSAAATTSSITGREQLLEYLAASANADVVINHNGHHPEIDLTGQDTAEALWYLQDWYFNQRDRRIVRGAAFYRDRCRKIDGAWLIQHTGHQ